MKPDELIDLVNRKYGKELTMAGDDSRLLIDKLLSGIPVLDMVLGGGFPRGRITELVGDYSSGKSLVTLLAVASAQKLGETCCYVDTEKAFDPLWAQALEVDLPKLVVSRPNTGEEAFDLIEKLVKAEAGVSLVVLDSLAHLPPTAEVEEEMSQQFMGQQAKLINKGLRKVISANDNTALILINQTRESIGKTFGNPEVLPGGKGQMFASSIILRVRRGSWLLEDKRRIGHLLKFKTEKNKLAPPWQECEVPFYYEGLIDREDGLVSLGLELGFIERSGAWYMFGGIKTKGREKFVEELREDEDVMMELRNQIEYGDDE